MKALQPAPLSQSDSSLDSSLTARSQSGRCDEGAMATVSAGLPERTVPSHPGADSSQRDLPVGDRGHEESRLTAKNRAFHRRKTPAAKRDRTEYLRDTCRNATGFLGVKHRRDRNDFVAYIRDPNGRKVYAGCGKTAEDAARAYDRKAHEFYGPGAVLNFPGSAP